MKKLYIELTFEQKQKLLPFFDEVAKHAFTDQVMLLAQIHTTGTNAVAVCAIVPNDKGLKMQEIMYGEKKVGEIAGDLHAEASLQKARAK